MLKADTIVSYAAASQPKNRPEMNILLSCDDRIAKYIPALQASLYENHRGIAVRIFIMHSKIPADIMKVIADFGASYGQEVVEILVGETDFEFIREIFINPEICGLWPEEAYYHLVAHEYLPPDLDRCVYMDVDIICNGNFYDWYRSDFDDSFFLTLSRGIPSGANFYVFNSGFFLINLKNLRKSNINKFFFTQKLHELMAWQSEGKIGRLLGDQQFLGFCYKDFPDNGFICRPSDELNFRLLTYEKPFCGVENLPDIKTIHYTVMKAWQYYFDESFLGLYIGEKKSPNHGFKFNFSVITEEMLYLYGLFWKYAEKAPFYEEIRARAVFPTEDLRQTSRLFTRNKRNEMLLQAVKNSTKSTDFLVFKPSYNKYNLICTSQNNYLKLKTQVYVKRQWIVFPLQRPLKKGECLALRFRCEFKSALNPMLFLSTYDLKTQHFPHISSNDYYGEVVANSDDYAFICLSSDSFRERGDYIIFYEMNYRLKPPVVVSSLTPVKESVADVEESTTEALKKETELLKYLDILQKIKDDYLIVLSVRDTPGSHLPKEAVQKVHELGFTKFKKDYGWMYVGVNNCGKVLSDTLSEACQVPVVYRYSDSALDTDIYAESMPYKNGNISKIFINGVDYSTNIQGLNFVVYDLEKGEVVDSVGFNYHPKDWKFKRAEANDYFYSVRIE